MEINNPRKNGGRYKCPEIGCESRRFTSHRSLLSHQIWHRRKDRVSMPVLNEESTVIENSKLMSLANMIWSGLSIKERIMALIAVRSR